MTTGCDIPGCIHQPGFVISCGYTLELATASVNPGWVSLVREAFEALPLGVRITQIKEKFGELTIYASDSYAPIKRRASDEISPSLARFNEKSAELTARSREICEFCGKPGEITGAGGGWLKAACADCADIRAATGNWSFVEERIKEKVAVSSEA